MKYYYIKLREDHPDSLEMGVSYHRTAHRLPNRVDVDKYLERYILEACYPHCEPDRDNDGDWVGTLDDGRIEIDIYTQKKISRKAFEVYWDDPDVGDGTYSSLYATDDDFIKEQLKATATGL